MPEYTVDLFRKEMNSLGKKIEGSKVALLGLSYKANVGDIRESPAFTIIELLEKQGVEVQPYDPYVHTDESKENMDKAIKGADAVIVSTNHDDFLNLTPEMLMKHRVDILIDGRNCLNKDDFQSKGIIYRGIGR